MGAQDWDVSRLPRGQRQHKASMVSRIPAPVRAWVQRGTVWFDRLPFWQQLLLVAVLAVTVGFGVARCAPSGQGGAKTVAVPEVSATATTVASRPSPSGANNGEGPAVPADRILSPTKSAATPAFTEPASATAAGVAFLQAWQQHNYSLMQQLQTDASVSMERVYGGMAQRLRIARIVVKPQVNPAAPAPAVPGMVATTATIPFTVTMTFTGYATPWSYQGQLQVIRNAQQQFRVQFTPATVYPGLTVGQKLQLVSVVSTQVQGVPQPGVAQPGIPQPGVRIPQPAQPVPGQPYPAAPAVPAPATVRPDGRMHIAVVTSSGAVTQHLATLTPGVPPPIS